MDRGRIAEENRIVSSPGIVIPIPGFGDREIRTVVSDFTGTLSRGGKIIPEVREKLLALLLQVQI